MASPSRRGFQKNVGVGHATDPYVTTSQEVPRSELNTIYWQFRVGSLLNSCSHLYSALMSIFSLYSSSCFYDCIKNHPNEKQMVFRIAVLFTLGLIVFNHKGFEFCLLVGTCVGPEVLFSLLLGYLDILVQELRNYTEVNINFEAMIIFSAHSFSKARN